MILVSWLLNLSLHYSFIEPRKGSIFPERLTYDGTNFRTRKANSVLLAFQCKSEHLVIEENEKATRPDGFSHWATFSFRT